jgi:acylphosphatase
MERRTAYYSGRVQGVGFRYAARAAAQGFALTGYVRNLDDGRVELVLEGESADIERLIATIRDRMSDYIVDIKSHTGPSTGEFRGFTVRD